MNVSCLLVEEVGQTRSDAQSPVYPWQEVTDVLDSAIKNVAAYLNSPSTNGLNYGPSKMQLSA